MGTGQTSIVILGAGFAGMGVAQELSKLKGDDDWHVTVVDVNNFLLFTPMLTEVAGGEVEPGSIVAAVRGMAPLCSFEQGRVESIDPAAKSVTISIGDAVAGMPPVQRTIEADHLVIALGSITNFHGIPGLADHAVGINTLSDAEAIRNRTIAVLERADEENDRDAQRALLTFVVGGGGFSGVETMAALNDMVRDLAPSYPNVDPGSIQCVLIQTGPRLLPEINERLASYAERALERRGVRIMLNTKVSSAGADFVEVEAQGGDRQRIAAHTLIWAGGVKPNPVVDGCGLKLGHHHGIVVDGCCRVQDHLGVWALGDCAEVPEPGGKGTYAPTAQNATREGALVARNIAAVLRGQQPSPFVYHPVGELAVVGKRSGVASLYGFRFSGFIAWAMWRAVYVSKLPSWPKRVRIVLEWLLDAMAGRDVSNLPGVTLPDGDTTNAAGGKGKEAARATK